MQIHELNNFTGTLGSGAYLAVDDGTDTGKLSTQQLLAATEARIDNIIAGPAPSAEEIVDARLGADGVTYPSLGDAIRDQFTDVKSDINAKDKTFYNSVHYGKDILTNSGYIKTDGTTGANASFGYSDIMEIPKGAKSITINRHTNFTAAAVAFYSEAAISSSAFVGYVASPNDTTLYENPIDVAIPSTAKYFAFSNRLDSASKYDFDAQINFDMLDIADALANIPELGADIEIKNSDLITASKYIKTDGTQASNNAFAASAMYEIPANAKEIVLSASGIIQTGCAIAFYYYNEFTKNSFISGVSVSSQIPSASAITLKIPSEAKYVAFSGRTADAFLATIVIETISDLLIAKPHKGEYLSILGDSISSYQGYIPEGNEYYYPQTYMSDVECSWWKRLLNETEMQLCVNNSWSGALMSGTSASAGINRADDLDDGVHTPDHIIVYMGVNDFKYPRDLGECGLNSDTYSATKFSDAYYTALNTIRTNYPNARLYLGTIMEFNYPNDGVTGFPIINSNDVNLIDFNNAIRKLADIFGAKVIEFTKCGVTYFNKSITLGDTAGLHPNAKGHNLMFEEALKHFVY